MNKKILFVTIVITSSMILSWSAAAQVKHTPSIEESLNLHYLGSPEISPDGQFIAYSIQETDWKNNQFVNQLWLANTVDGTNVQITRGPASADSASWSPDGRWLAFVTERAPTAPEPDTSVSGEGKLEDRQIWLISPHGGEAWELSDSQTGVGQIHWSQDSKSIAFIAPAPESVVSKKRTLEYGDYQVFGKDFRQNQLWSVDVAEAIKTFQPVKPTRLIDDPLLNVVDFAWSPDSKRIVLTASSSPLLSSYGTQDIYLLDLAHGGVGKKIVAFPGPDFSPMFSPDGKEIAFLSWLGQPDYFYANLHIAVIDVATALDKPVSPSSDIRDVTAHFDECPALLAWAPDGIYFSAYQKTDIDIFSVDPRTLRLHRVSMGENEVIEGASFTGDFRTIAFVSEDSTHMPELYVSHVAPFAPKKLTDMTAQVKDWNLGTPEVIRWKSQDGTEIEGVLYKPANYDPHRKYPLLVEMHGGPADASRPILAPAEPVYPLQQFLSKGALVLKPNYRGSAGYGAAFRGLDMRNIGSGEMSDVMSGVDCLIALGIVDPTRMGAIGSSWGGYVASFLATHTDRFKAISESSGITDLMTEYVNTDNTALLPQFFHATPWQNPEIYSTNSPVTTVTKAKTPVLLQEGMTDKRVPPPNAYEFYRALQDVGVASRLIFYAGFGHGENQPKPMLAATQANLDWFDHYLWGEPIPKDSPLLGNSEVDK